MFDQSLRNYPFFIPGLNPENPLEFNAVSSDFNLVDTDGYVYPVQFWLYGETDQISSFSLSIGEKVKGFVWFLIYETATPSYIRYENLYIGLN